MEHKVDIGECFVVEPDPSSVLPGSSSGMRVEDIEVSLQRRVVPTHPSIAAIRPPDDEMTLFLLSAGHGVHLASARLPVVHTSRPRYPAVGGWISLSDLRR